MMERSNNSKEFLKDIVENFSTNKFVKFFRDKNTNFSPIDEKLSQYTNEDFISGEKIGEIKFQDDNLIICAFKVLKELTERSGKKKQYEVGKKVLKETNTDAGIFIFYDENENFRFSLIYTEYFGTRRRFSYFRRFTYLVSPRLTNKTFLEQIGKGDFSSLENIKSAFSVEPVTKQFYEEIQNWYFWAMDKVIFPEDYKYSDGPDKDKEIRTATNLISLITRIIFIWFIKEKGLVPEILFDRTKLKDIIRDFGGGNNYYNAILQNLFFATLNQKMEKRKFTREDGYPANKEEYGVKTLYRYKYKFSISEKEILNLFKDIPFLNGGLFDCLDKEDEQGKVIYIDGFSRNPKKQAIIPDYLFFQQEEERVDLSQYGLGLNKPVRGLIGILKSYNFTIDENIPIDQEIALDPELLGKVFENLLASYNPETATTARKATGSYYTPREIVGYMVDESLKEYFKTHLPEIDEEKIELLVSYVEEVPEFSEEERQSIISAIDRIKILDPACGSGAFPMGILHKLVYILQRIDPDNNLWRELQYQKALKASEEVFKETDKVEREEMLKDINETFDESINYPDYARKLYLIENCVYGVDIQPIAIQISKLRFFISLVLDQKVDRTKENFGINPLPNLETKFVAANTLIGLDRPQQLQLRNPAIEKKEKELNELRHKYFIAKTRTQKQKLQETDKKIRKDLADLLKKDGWGEIVANKIAYFDIFDQNASPEWFDPEWMFGVNDGFDIVIGNPPYVSFGLRGMQKINKELEYYIRKRFPNSAEYKISLYALFIDKGIQLLRYNGLLSYITPDSFLLGRYFSKIRHYIVSSTLIKKIILFEEDFWHVSNVGRPVISFFLRTNEENKINNNHIISMLCPNPQSLPDKTIKSYTYPQNYFSSLKYNRFRLFFSEKSMKLVKTIEYNSIPLGDIAKITTGVRSKIGQKNIISKECKGSTWKKGIISGAQVLPFLVKWEGYYINIDRKLLWAGGWDADIVESPKIMIRQTGDSIIAGIDYARLYHLNNTHSLKINNDGVLLEFICAVLNSNLMNKYYRLITLEFGRALAQTDIETLELLPIKIPSYECQTEIAKLVKDIIANYNISFKREKLISQIEELIFKVYDIDDDFESYINDKELY